MSDPVYEKEVNVALEWSGLSFGCLPSDHHIRVLASEVRRLRAVVKDSLITETKTQKLWHMDITLPKSAEQPWQKNERIAIAADTLEEAVQKAREVYPTATLWKVNHGGKLHLV